jgi:carbonic anhydrase/acetyltransferase-like protein (isoleucine patch superfamily)
MLLSGGYMIIAFKGNTPLVSETAFVAGSAEIIGDVEVGEYSSVWFNAVVRGDMGKISIGKRTSIQDNVVIHPLLKVEIGDNVSVGHGAVLHGCKIRNNVIIGMNSTVLDGSEIGENSIVGANALIPPGKTFPENSVITGVPGKVSREVTDQDIEIIQKNAAEYVDLVAEYKKEQKT